MNHGNVSPQIAKGLLALKERIAAAKIPSSKLDETLNLATWNIREFGKRKRSVPAIHYIAEILGQFDLIGVVELRDNLTDLGRVLRILGPYWKSSRARCRTTSRCGCRCVPTLRGSGSIRSCRGS